MRETLEAWVGLMMVMAFLGFLLSCLLLWTSEKLSRSQGTGQFGFKKIFWAAAGATALLYSMTCLFLLFPRLSAAYGFFLGLLLTLILFKSVFPLPWSQVFIRWALNGIAQGLAVWIGAELFVGGMGYLLKIL
jgi:hypothetical protein